MWGWLSEASTCASRWKRARRSGSSANVSGMTFNATSRPSFVSRARYTSPIPPAPRAERISYAPTRVPAFRSMLSGMCGSRVSCHDPEISAGLSSFGGGSQGQLSRRHPRDLLVGHRRLPRERRHEDGGLLQLVLAHAL